MSSNMFLKTISKSSSTLFFRDLTKYHLSKRYYTNSNNNSNDSNNNINLSQKKCIPCEGDIDALDMNEKIKLLKNLNNEWKMSDDYKKILRVWRVPFPEAIKHLQDVSQIAEEEGHHPDVSINSYWNLKIEIYTHSINDLTENDFILASKIDKLKIQPNRPSSKKNLDNLVNKDNKMK